MLIDAYEKDCKAAVVISNESDLMLPIEVVKDRLGLTVGVVNPHPALRRSRALQPSFFKQIRESTFKASQLPPSLSDEHGKIHKPSSW